MFLLLHIYLLSKVPTYKYHIPIQSGYSYPEIVPVSIALMAIVLYAYRTSHTNIVLSNILIWFAFLSLTYSLRFAGWPTVPSNEVIVAGVIVILLTISSAILPRIRRLKRKQRTRLARITAFVAVFSSLAGLSRVLQLIYINNSQYTISNSYFTAPRAGANNSSLCKAEKRSVYGSSKVRSLVIILDAYPVEGRYMSLVHTPSVLHGYLKDNAIVYHESTTVMPYTPYSLAFLLAGIQPNPFCTYPAIDGSRTIRLALGSSYFKTSNSICDASRGYFGDNLRFFMLKPLFWFNRNLRKELVNDYLKTKDEKCSIISTGLVEKVIAWSSGGTKDPNNLDIIHELYFHNHHPSLGPSGIRKVDREYASFIKNLSTSLSMQPKIYDQIIVMSDHGPRQTNLGLNDRSQKRLKRSTASFIDHYSMFYAIIALGNGKSVLSPTPNTKNLYYYANERGMPARIPSDP